MAEEPTSIKQAIQKFSGENLNVVVGKVMKTSPLKVALVNDMKGNITEETLLIPKHVTGLSKGKELWLLPLRNGAQYFVLGLR